MTVLKRLGLALAWTATEWLRATFTAGHLDLYGIGYSQARFRLARLALQGGDLDRVEELILEIRAIEDSLGRGPRQG